MKPEPEPEPPMRPPVVVWMVTTAGATASTALITALDSSIVRSRTLLASPPGVDVTPAAGSASRFTTPTADGAPDRRPATTAVAMSGTAPGPRRTTVCCGAGGGRVDHAGAARHEALDASPWGAGP